MNQCKDCTLCQMYSNGSWNCSLYGSMPLPVGLEDGCYWETLEGDAESPFQKKITFMSVMSGGEII